MLSRSYEAFRRLAFVGIAFFAILLPWASAGSALPAKTTIAQSTLCAAPWIGAYASPRDVAYPCSGSTSAPLGLVDTFANTGLLSANNADTGQVWGPALADLSGYNTNFIILAGNELYTNNASGGSDAAVAYAKDDALIIVHVLAISGLPEVGVDIRNNGTGITGYMGRFVFGSGWQFFNVSPGPTYTQLGSNVAGTLVDGDIIRFTASGSGATVTLTLFQNGTQVAQSLDTNAFRFTATGNVGIHLFNPGGLTTTNYQVHKITAP